MTASTSHHTLYIFAMMLFGLKQYPAAFQRAVDVTVFYILAERRIISDRYVAPFKTTCATHLAKLGAYPN